MPFPCFISHDSIYQYYIIIMYIECRSYIYLHTICLPYCNVNVLDIIWYLKELNKFKKMLFKWMDNFLWVLNTSMLGDLSKGCTSLERSCDSRMPTALSWVSHQSFGQHCPGRFLTACDSWDHGQRGSFTCVPDPGCIFGLPICRFRVKWNRSNPELALTSL